MNLDKISNLIKTKRKEKNLTQKELALKLNVTEKAISRWETKRGTPDISLLIPLANELGVNVSEILSGKENKNANKNIEEVIKYLDINHKHKNTKFLILTIIIYIILLFLYLTYLKFEYSPKISLTFYNEIIFNLFFVFLIFIANQLMTNYYFDKIENKEKMKKVSTILIMIMYTIFIFNYTVLSRNIGETRINLTPFKTISEYIVYNQKFNNDIIIKNILGNILVFMPIEYFILKIKIHKNFKSIFMINFLIVFSLELLQHLTHTGVLDIDDMILNLIGMTLIYIIYLTLTSKKRSRF